MPKLPEVKNTIMRKGEHFDENEPLLEGNGLPAGAWRFPSAPEGFREALLTRTSAHVRARARRRRLVIAGAVAAAYVAGLATAFGALNAMPGRKDHLPVISEVSHPEPVPAPTTAQSALAPDIWDDPEQFALLYARSPRDRQAELLKAAGDRYLNEFADVKQALNYYRRLLAIAPPEHGTEPDLDDTWLLRSLKQARLQEEHHEHTNS